MLNEANVNRDVNSSKFILVELNKFTLSWLFSPDLVAPAFALSLNQRCYSNCQLFSQTSTAFLEMTIRFI